MACDSAPGRTQRPVQSQFADHAVLLQSVGTELAAGDQNPERNRQIERCRLLGEIGGRQVDHNPVNGSDVPAVDQRPLDAVRALADGRLGESDQNCLRHRRGGDVDLDFDRSGFDAEQ